MRCVVWLALTASTGMTWAQDVSQQALQIQQQQQIQQGIQQQQIQQQQTDLINQQQLNQLTVAGLSGLPLRARTPRLEEEPGTRPGTVMVRMSEKTRGASIFYTLDGWTPTAASLRYEGPIAVGGKATVRAIALGPGAARSPVAVLPVVAGSGGPAAVDGPVRVNALLPGTVLDVFFTAAVSSRGRRVGDALPVALAQDVFVGGTLMAARGTPVTAIVTQVDKSYVQGLPGSLRLAVKSVTLRTGEVVPLLGVATMEGTSHARAANLASIVPLGGVAVHGEDALIPQGMVTVSRVAAAVSLGTH